MDLRGGTHLDGGNKAFQRGHTPAAAIGGHAEAKAGRVLQFLEDDLDIGEETFAKYRRGCGVRKAICDKRNADLG